MKTKGRNHTAELLQGLAFIAACLVGLFFLGAFDPVPERSTEKGGVFLYYGPEGETVPVSGADAGDMARAEAALAGADYFAAYATGPGGRSGVWIGARSPELARAHALARCGAGCSLVAERLPLHRDASRSEPVLTHAMAIGLGVKWPFINEVLAVGGANAWGHGTKSAGSAGWRMAKRDAAEDCEIRRAAEMPPDPGLSGPCLLLSLEDIIDLRPKPARAPPRAPPPTMW